MVFGRQFTIELAIQLQRLFASLCAPDYVDRRVSGMLVSCKGRSLQYLMHSCESIADQWLERKSARLGKKM